MNKYFSKISFCFINSFWRHYISWSFLITTVFTICYALIIYAKYGELTYTDTDCYTRALRMVDWLQDFQWREKIFPYTNHPDGFVLHFTRISDVIWLVFTLPFLLFMPLKEAVFYGGFFFSPLFLFITLSTFLWGVKPFLEKTNNNRLFFFILFLFSLIFYCKLSLTFDFYRPDHHCIMCFVFSFVISAILRSYTTKHCYRNLFLAGIFTGCGLWASSAPEGFYVAGIALLILITDVIFSKKSTKNPLYYCLGFFYANLGAWLINPPFDGYAALDNTRLSIVHVVLSAFMLVSFTVWHLCNFKSKLKQISVLFVLACSSAVLMLILFGTKNLFTPVYAEPVKNYFLPYIGEMRPLGNYFLPPVAVGMLIVSYLSVKIPIERCLTILYVTTAFLCMFVARFYSYYLSVWVILFAFGLSYLWKMKDKSDKYKIAAFLYIIWPIFYWATFDIDLDKTPDMKLNGIVLADTFDGPELVWKYNIDTVASPYHTNIEGIRDNRIMWFTSDENELKTLLKKRDVNIVTMKGVIESCYYPDPKNNTDKLYGKVWTGENIYPWMEKTDEKTYRINYDKF